MTLPSSKPLPDCCRRTAEEAVSCIGDFRENARAMLDGGFSDVHRDIALAQVLTCNALIGFIRRRLLSEPKEPSDEG